MTTWSKQTAATKEDSVADTANEIGIAKLPCFNVPCCMSVFLLKQQFLSQLTPVTSKWLSCGYFTPVVSKMAFIKLLRSSSAELSPETFTTR